MEICKKCGCRIGYNHECHECCNPPPPDLNSDRLRQLRSLDNETLAKRVVVLEQRLAQTKT
jgi:hypothetical protein